MSLRSALASRDRSRRQSGYALLFAIFLVATLILITAVATPSVLTEGRREREKEMIWRGNQYVRAIRLYYQKYGHFPTSIADLTRPDATGLHFLRQAYKDPMNKVDGSWRLIYVGPGGQLIGSVRYHSLQEMASELHLGNGEAGAAKTSGTGQSSTDQNAASSPQSPAFGTTTSSNQPQSLGLQPVSGPVLGGAVIGVGSKVKQPSLRVYQGGTSYNEWEFIWNPLANGISISSPAAGSTKPATGTGGTTGTAAPSAPSGASGSQSPPAGPMAPPPTPDQPDSQP